MRKKNEASFGVADGFDFGSGTETIIEEATVETIVTPEKKKKASAGKTEKTEIDSNRSYSPYYTPKPKKGSKGGILGRGAVDESQRKIQVSLTCTSAQKERFAQAAKKDKRKLPDFICIAVEEYIKNHRL